MRSSSVSCDSRSNGSAQLKLILSMDGSSHRPAVPRPFVNTSAAPPSIDPPRPCNSEEALEDRAYRPERPRHRVRSRLILYNQVETVGWDVARKFRILLDW